MIDSWYSKNKESVETVYFKQINSYLPDKNIFWNMVHSILYFSLNVDQVECTQKLAPQWKNHISELYPLCDKEFFCFVNKIEGEFSNIKTIVDNFLSGKYPHYRDDNLVIFLRQHVLSQLFIILEHTPSQFYKYSFSRKFSSALLEKIYKNIR